MAYPRQLILISLSAVFAVIVVCLSFYIHHNKLNQTEYLLSLQQLQAIKISDLQSLHHEVLLADTDEIQGALKSLILYMSKETKPWIKSLLPFNEWLESYQRINERLKSEPISDEYFSLVQINSVKLKSMLGHKLSDIRQTTVDLNVQLNEFFIVFTASILLIVVDMVLFIYFYSKQVFNSQKERIKQEVALDEEHSRLSISIKEKSNLLRMLNQEVRTPLHQISGVTDMLEKDLQRQFIGHDAKRGSDKIGAERIVLLKRSVDELLVVLNNVVSYTEIDSGASEIESEKIDVRRFCQSLYLHIKPLADDKSLKFPMSISKNIPKCVHLDKPRVEQVLVHLLKNSIKYTAKGGVKLQVGVVDDAVLSNIASELHAQITNKPHVVFSISDTGCGLSQKDQNLINSALSDIHGGHNQFATSCLGMAITQKLVCFMHGFMYVRSDLNKGTAVYVLLPLNKASYIERSIDEHEEDASQLDINIDSPVMPSTSSVQSLMQSYSPSENTHSLMILIAEDIESNADLLTWMLEDLGHQVDVTTNGEECIEQLKKKNYDVIFMDQFMPIMDGQSATIKIRCMAGSKSSTPIIGCTADSQKPTLLMLKEAGQNAVMTKPLQMDKLVKVLNAL